MHRYDLPRREAILEKFLFEGQNFLRMLAESILNRTSLMMLLDRQSKREFQRKSLPTITGFFVA
jgi:hypothetical protein